MPLSELLQDHTLEEIASRTNIAPNNLQALFNGEFEVLKRAKALGFISILEREYHLDLEGVKKEAKAYYEAHQEEEGMTVSHALVDERRGTPLWVFLIALGLLGYVSWYFLSHFQAKTLSENEGVVEPKSVNLEGDVNPMLNIETVIANATKTPSEAVSVIEMNKK
jgi:cytoskeletal protein RodZ